MRPTLSLHINTEHGWRGGEAQTLMLARGLRERGQQVIVAAREGGGLAHRAEGAGLETWTHPMRSEFDPGAILGIARLMRSRRPSIVHYHTSHAVTLGTLARLLAAPAVPDLRAVLTRRVSFSLKRNPLARIKYRFRIDHVIAVADGVRWVLIQEGLRPDSISVIHSAIDLSRFGGADLTDAAARFRQDLGVSGDGNLLGSVGALVEHKGHAILIEAFGEIAPARPGLHLALVGDGPLRAQLESQASAAGVGDRIHFTGHRDDIPAVMTSFDLFVLPSISGEGSPAVVKEAMACGVPVVASGLEGVREIVEEGTEGLLVPPGSPASLSEAIVTLLDDPASRERLVQRGRKRVRDFSVERMVERTLEVYGRVVAGRSTEAGLPGHAP